jgi:hypothetical protein
MQWSAFVRKNGLAYAPQQFSEVTASVSVFLEPVLNGLLTRNIENRFWDPPGPWKITNE